MRNTRIKIVPDADPNGEGEWLDITTKINRDLIQDGPGKYPTSSWADQADFLQRYCPEGFHVVSIETDS